MTYNRIVINEDRNVTLDYFIQSVSGEFGNIKKRPAIIVLPGGGYAICSDREADPVALAYSKAGFQSFILRYTLKAKGRWDYPLKDYEETVQYILSHAEELSVDTDRIAVCGFSAGGHLAAYAATTAEHRPTAAILGYSALDNDVCEVMLPGLPYPSQLIDNKTCPCFLFACRDDNIADIGNTLRFQDALHKNGIYFESHIYSYGGHGFSTAEQYLNPNPISSRAKHWVNDSIEWLSEVWGQFTATGFTAPMYGRTINANNEKTLSVNCTLKYLNDFSESVRTLVKPADDGVKAILQGGEMDPDKAYGVISAKFKVKDILKLIGYSDSKIEELNQLLHGINNCK